MNSMEKTGHSNQQHAAHLSTGLEDALGHKDFHLNAFAKITSSPAAGDESTGFNLAPGPAEATWFLCLFCRPQRAFDGFRCFVWIGKADL